jgi:hypothetical protein
VRVRKSLRNQQKIGSEKNKSDPSPFSYSDPPTHHGGRRFFFAAPWLLAEVVVAQLSSREEWEGIVTLPTRKLDFLNDFLLVADARAWRLLIYSRSQPDTDTGDLN